MHERNGSFLKRRLHVDVRREQRPKSKKSVLFIYVSSREYSGVLTRLVSAKNATSSFGSLADSTYSIMFISYTLNPRDVYSRALKDVVAEDVCFALLVGRHSARSEVDGSVSACAAAFRERAGVNAQD